MALTPSLQGARGSEPPRDPRGPLGRLAPPPHAARGRCPGGAEAEQGSLLPRPLRRPRRHASQPHGRARGLLPARSPPSAYARPRSFTDSPGRKRMKRNDTHEPTIERVIELSGIETI